VLNKYQKTDIGLAVPAVPEQVSVTLAELAGEVQEGLLALAVGTGLQVMAAMMEADVISELGRTPGAGEPAADARHRWLRGTAGGVL
jgi:putative transposase